MLDNLPRSSEKRQPLYVKRKARLQRLKSKKLAKIQEEFSANQGVEDIEKQYQGYKFQQNLLASHSHSHRCNRP